MGIAELLQKKREDILRIATRYGALNVWVFGSVARGEATADSDMDFLVDLASESTLCFVFSSPELFHHALEISSRWKFSI